MNNLTRVLRGTSLFRSRLFSTQIQELKPDLAEKTLRSLSFSDHRPYFDKLQELEPLTRLKFARAYFANFPKNIEPSVKRIVIEDTLEVLPSNAALSLFLEHLNEAIDPTNFVFIMRLFDKIFKVDTHNPGFYDGRTSAVVVINDASTHESRLAFAYGVRTYLNSGTNLCEMLMRLHAQDRLAFAMTQMDRLEDMKSALQVLDFLFPKYNALHQLNEITKESAPIRMALVKSVIGLVQEEQDYASLRRYLHSDDRAHFKLLLASQGSAYLPPSTQVSNDFNLSPRGAEKLMQSEDTIALPGLEWQRFQ